MSEYLENTSSDDPNEQKARQYRKLVMRSSAFERAMEGWDKVDDTRWVEINAQAVDDYHDGSFLIRQLGGARFIDPQTMSVLMGLRRSLLDECGEPTACEMMMVDLVVLGYYHFLRVNGWIGNLSMVLESEFFGQEPLSKRPKKSQHEPDGLLVEDVGQRLLEDLFPLADRASRAVARNLKVLRELRQMRVEKVAVNKVDNFCVGTQVNVR